jgi:hypothetical protein
MWRINPEASAHKAELTGKPEPEKKDAETEP